MYFDLTDLMAVALKGNGVKVRESISNLLIFGQGYNVKMGKLYLGKRATWPPLIREFASQTSKYSRGVRK
jgi:hypothetical protein